MIEVVIKASGGVALAFLGIALAYWLWKGQGAVFAALKGLMGIASLGAGLGLLASVVFYIQGQVDARTVVPYAAGAVCLALVWMSPRESKGGLLLASLLALSPIIAFYLHPVGSRGSGESLLITYAGLAALGCGLLLSEGVCGAGLLGAASINLRRLYTALLFLLVGSICRAWWDKLLLGVYWPGGLEGKGAVLELLLSAAAMNLRHFSKRAAMAVIAVLSLGGLWGLTLGYI